MKTLSVLILTFFFSAKNAELQAIEDYVLSYSIENVKDENQLINLTNDLQNLYKDCFIKHRYKPENNKGQIVINYKEGVSKGENQKQKIDPSVIKQKIIHYGMSPVDYTLEKTK